MFIPSLYPFLNGKKISLKCHPFPLLKLMKLYVLTLTMDIYNKFDFESCLFDNLIYVIIGRHQRRKTEIDVAVLL